MRWSLKSGRRQAGRLLIDALEARQMLSGETASAIPSVLANIASPAANSITLDQYFNDSLLPGTLATFDTNEGTVQVALTDAATPQTVANFLDYVNSGEYTDTIFHRSVDLTTNLGGSPTAPGTIIQGGGYTVGNGSLTHIAVNAPVPDEYTTELYGNVAGTLAMAKTSEANSATSEWYFNVTDNTELDTPTTDDNGNTTSYTVFGSVLSGSSVVSAIAALPTTDFGNGLDTVPVAGLTEAQLAAGATVTAKNLVFVTQITTEPGTEYTVDSSDKALVAPKVTDGVLSFTYSPTLSGTAEITITAANLDGTTATTVVDVTVPNAATPSAGPVAANVTAPFTQTGTTGDFSVLSQATDSVAAVDPTSVTIVTGPTNGTASVDTTTGHIKYTPNSGYLGSDSLTYSFADTNGTRSNVATVTLDAVPGPAVVSVGGPKEAKSLTFTEPDGVVSHLTIASGTAHVTFADYRVNFKTVNGIEYASGLGTTITGITVTDKVTVATLSISSNGPVQMGPIQDQFHLTVIAPTVTLTGTSAIGSSDVFKVAALVDANLTFNTSPVPIQLFIPTVTDSSITSNTSIALLRSNAWINSDGGDYSITAPQIIYLQVTGDFEEGLNLTGRAYNLIVAKVGTPTAAWNLSGSALNVTIGTPDSGWSLNSGGLVSTLAVKGNLANSLEAAAIGTMSVSGTSSGSTIQTDANFSKSFQQIKKISFGGAISDTVIFSAGNIGSVSAASMTNSRIYAGVALTVAEDGKLAAATTDLSNDARIASVSLGKATTAFSNALISAYTIGALKLGNISTSNSGTAEGVSAHTISSISGTLVPGGILKAGPAQLKTAAALTAYETLKKITLGDFAINFF